MTYSASIHPLQILQRIEFEEAVGPGDPRFVDTEEARGSPRTLDRIARKFGLNMTSGEFYPATKRHSLLFGHIGCGKTTELLHLSEKLRAGRQLYVVNVDVLNELDRNNLQYADALMALAKGLLATLAVDNVSLEDGATRGLEQWFAEHVKTEDRAKELVAQLETSVKSEIGIPFLAKLFAGFTAAAKTNATYKDSLRIVIRNTFTQFADAFNAFLRSAEASLRDSGKGQRILFVVDSTDKLSSEDTKRFFVDDAEQLLAIEALMLYTAPLSLKYDGIPLGKVDDIVLPVIKLKERNGSAYAAGCNAMRSMLLRRADQSVFSDPALIDKIVEFSGGHPRELLRLLKLCCEFAEGDKIDPAAVTSAIKALASDYRRFLEPEDYVLLVQMDRESEQHGGNNERTRRLLYRLALIEYNDGGWRRSHPVVRLLEGYANALQASASR
jgi:Ni2+-binding GTPase involved in maturation of urease and hydrogenase